MRRAILLLISILLFGCSVVKKIGSSSIHVRNITSGNEFQKLIDLRKDTIFISSSKILIDRPIVLRSNVTIIGNNSTTFTYNPAKKFNRFVINGQSNISLKDFSFEADDVKIVKFNGGYYPFKVTSSSNLVFDNISFDKIVNTCMSLNDVNNVKIKNCSFNNIGRSTKGNVYSYDGIYIGAYNIGTDDVEISNCTFKNIGMKEGGSYTNDGDGVQTYSKNSTIENIVIKNCKFQNISRRGIKIQSGSNISIRNNSFEHVKMILGIAMENSTAGIQFIENTIKDAQQGVNTNSYKNNPCVSSHLIVKDNIFINLGGIMRTSGASHISDAVISNNKFENIDNYIFSGKITNSIFDGNTILEFQSNPHPKLKIRSAIILWNGSHGNRIVDNKFSDSKTNVSDVFLYKETKNNLVKKNVHMNSRTKTVIINRSSRNSIH